MDLNSFLALCEKPPQTVAKRLPAPLFAPLSKRLKSQSLSIGASFLVVLFVQRLKSLLRNTLFVHIDTDIPEWMNQNWRWNLVRFKSVKEPALKHKQKGDVLLSRRALVSRFDGRSNQQMCVPCFKSATFRRAHAKRGLCSVHAGMSGIQVMSPELSVRMERQGRKTMSCY